MDGESDHEQGKIERLRRAMYSRMWEHSSDTEARHALEPESPVIGERWERQSISKTQPNVSPRVSPEMMKRIQIMVRSVAILAGLFFVGALAFFAYYFSFGSGFASSTSNNIDISILGPTHIAGGEATQLQIMVTNRNSVPLELADLVVSYPQGTRSRTDYATDMSVQRISLGTIDPGVRRQGIVTAVFSGDTNSPVDVKAELEYRLPGSNAIFVAHSEYSTVLSSSPITLSVEGREQIVSGQPLEMTLTVSSNTNEVIRDVLVSAEYPFGFTSKNASPSQKRPGVWEIGDLAPGQKRTIVMRGTLTGESGDARTFRFAAGTRATPQDQNISTQLASDTLDMRISDPFLGLSVSVNGEATDKPISLAPGSDVRVAVQWVNNLQTTIDDAVIVARLSGVQIDGADVRTIDGFYRSSDGVVLWDKSTTKGALSSLPPKTQGTVSFSFTLPDSDALKGMRAPMLTISINAAGKRISETDVPQNLQSVASQKILLASDLHISAEGLYKANPFGSTGPLPPKAGAETTYAIVFTLTNTTNQITGGTLTARLPPYVRWTGTYSGAEHLAFNADEGVFTWDVGSVQPGVGMNGTDPRQIVVNVGLTPSTSQIGQEPVLIQDIQFSGTDSVTGERVEKTVKDVTTRTSTDTGFVPTTATVIR